MSEQQDMDTKHVAVADCSFTKYGFNKFVRGIERQMKLLPEDSFDVTLLEDMCSWRHKSRKKTRKHGLWLALYGFGSNRKKILLFRMLRYALGPSLLVGSTIAENRWEAMMLLETWRPEFEELEAFCDKFKSSIGITDIGGYMDPVMIACYERIQAGTLLFGNIFLSKNSEHHRNLESFLQKKKEAERTTLAEQEMGVPYNLRNMLVMHRSLRNLQVEHSQTQRNTIDLRTHIVSVLQSMHVIDSIARNSPLVRYGRLNDSTDNTGNQENTENSTESSESPADVMTSHILQNIQDLENLSSRLLQIQQSMDDAPGTVTHRWMILRRSE